MTLPIDRTAKAVIDANLVNGVLSDGPKLKANDDVIYNTIDELYNYASALVTTGNLLYLRTAADVTYYVRPDGNDANTGLANTAGAAFKTIARALDILPQIVNHNITINVAAGLYGETLTIIGRVGKGILTIIGDTVASNNYRFTNIIVKNNSIAITIQGVSSSTSGIGFQLYANISVTLDKCQNDFSASQYGFLFESGHYYIKNSVISNRSAAIKCENAIVSSVDNTGSANQTVLECSHAGKIGKGGTQPSGTVAENAYYGGQIV